MRREGVGNNHQRSVIKAKERQKIMPRDTLIKYSTDVVDENPGRKRMDSSIYGLKRRINGVTFC